MPDPYLANDSLSTLIKEKALLSISEYEALIDFNSTEKRQAFEGLFHLPGTLIFNDVMPENKLSEKVTPAQYIKLIQKYYTNLGFKEVGIYAKEMSTVSVENEYAMLSINAKKYVNSITRYNVIYTDTFLVRFDFIYYFNNNTCKIYGISSAEKRGEYLLVYPQYQSLFKTKNLAGDSIRISDEVFEVNKVGYVMLKNVNENSELLFQPLDKRVYFNIYKKKEHLPIWKKNRSAVDKNVIKINFRNWTSFIEFNYQTSINNRSPVNIQTDTLGIITTTGSTFSNFILFNFTRKVAPRGYWSIKLGAGADVLNYSSYMENNVSSSPTTDPNQEEYIRINRVYDVHVKHHLSYITIPFIIEKGFSFGKNSFFVNGAYYTMLNYSSRYNLDANAIYSGKYIQFNDLLLQEKGSYDFGLYNFQLRNSYLMVDRMIFAYGFGVGYSRLLTRKIHFDVAYNYRTSKEYIFLENKQKLSESYTQINNLNNLNHRFYLDYVNLSFGLRMLL